LKVDEAQERPRRPRMMEAAPPDFDDYSFDGKRKKPRKAKGSRRGLRARKRSL
jgi:hypothetical protein